MKKYRLQLHFPGRVLLALVLGLAAIVFSGLVYRWIPFVRTWFPFIGELLLVLVTWMLYRMDGQSLSRIGLRPGIRNLGFLLLGLGVGVVALGLVTLLRTLYTGEQWHVSTAIDFTALLKSLYTILPAVVVEELMFRGYLFTKTIDATGVVRANIIFAFLFMLVHVLDRDVLQNPGKMIMLAVTIPVGHLLFATALLRSGTLFFPIGIHWGNNWAVNHLAGMSDNGQVLFFTTHQKIYTTWPPFIILLLIFNVFFLLVTLIIWKWKRPVEGERTS